MPYEGLGARHTAVATKACVHGQIVVEDRIVGTAFKVEQLDRFVRPTSAEATQIVVGEEFEIQVGGVHEAPLTGALAYAGVGDRVYIAEDDNTLTVDSGGAEANEVQSLAISGSPTGGTFRLTLDGEETADINVTGLSAAAIQAALEGLASVDPGDVTVTGSGPYVITFGAGYGDQNVPQLTVTSKALTGGSSPDAAVTTTTAGSGGTIPVGVVTEVDASRSPDVARINSNAWQAFLPGA
jgi:hypothetical protein